MKRFLALWALVLVLMAGTAGMASASTIGFDSYPPSLPNPPPPINQDNPDPPSLPYPPEISGTTNMVWDDTGCYGGHLWFFRFTRDSTISFTSPTYVNNFQMNGMRNTDPYDPSWMSFGPMVIEAFTAAGVKVWGTTVEFGEDNRDVGNYLAWLTVPVSTAAISSIIFRAPDPGGLNGTPWFYPSIDNLVINEAAAVPIPASVWLLASGLLALVGLRRKFSR